MGAKRLYYEFSNLAIMMNSSRLDLLSGDFDAEREKSRGSQECRDGLYSESFYQKAITSCLTCRKSSLWANFIVKNSRYGPT